MMNRPRNPGRDARLGAKKALSRPIYVRLIASLLFVVCIVLLHAALSMKPVLRKARGRHPSTSSTLAVEWISEWCAFPEGFMHFAPFIGPGAHNSPHAVVAPGSKWSLWQSRPASYRGFLTCDSTSATIGAKTSRQTRRRCDAENSALPRSPLQSAAADATGFVVVCRLLG